MNKSRNYRNNNASERVPVSKVSNPVRLIGGKVVEVDRITGKPLSCTDES